MAKHWGTLRAFLARLADDQKGTAAIEFGIIGTLLLLMMVMGTDLGLAMRHKSQMEGAVRAGLQRALDGTSALEDVQAAALAAADLPVSPAATATAARQCVCADGTVVDCDTGTCGALEKLEYVELELVQDHAWLFGIPGVPNPTSFTIKRSMRVD
jgi:Flp pilus assembly protein TadG